MNFNKLILKPLAISLALTSSVAIAQSKDQDSYFLLGETAAGKSIKDVTGATIYGMAQVGYSRNDVTSSEDKRKSRSNTIAGPSDEGAQLNGVIVGIEKLLEANFIPRITPLPGPMSEKFSWGFRTDLHYGRDALMSASNGIENTWPVSYTHLTLPTNREV